LSIGNQKTVPKGKAYIVTTRRSAEGLVRKERGKREKEPIDWGVRVGSLGVCKLRVSGRRGEEVVNKIFRRLRKGDFYGKGGG